MFFNFVTATNFKCKKSLGFRVLGFKVDLTMQNLEIFGLGLFNLFKNNLLF
jgi:hypothetical protein